MRSVRIDEIGEHVGQPEFRRPDRTILRRPQQPWRGALELKRRAIPEIVQQLVELLAEIVGRSQVTGRSEYVVTDEKNEYLGLLNDADVRAVMLAPESAPLLLVGEVMRTNVPPLKPADTLEAAWDLFARYDVDQLASGLIPDCEDASRPTDPRTLFEHAQKLLPVLVVCGMGEEAVSCRMGGTHTTRSAYSGRKGSTR